MKFGNGYSHGMTRSLLPSPHPSITSIAPQYQHDFRKRIAFAIVGAAALYLLSLLLPEDLSTIAQDLMCWFLLGAIAAALLVAGVKLLDGFLDL